MMDKTQVCRLCLKICDRDFNNLEDITQEITFFLALNIDLNISSDPVVCDGCIENLRKCYKFKVDCLYKGNVSFCVKSEDEKLNLYTDKAPTVATTVGAGGSGNTCYFCMASLHSESFVVLNSQNRELQIILEKYFPELVSIINEGSRICTPCYESLQSHAAFMTDCLDIEEKIRKYCKIEGTNTKGQVELIRVLYFMSKDALGSEDNNHVHNIVNVGNELCEQIKDEPVEIKDENIVGIGDQELIIINEHEPANLDQHEQDRSTYEPTISSSAAEVKDKYDLRYDGIDKLQRRRCTRNSPSKVTVHKCTICSYQSKHKSYINKHMLVHKDESEVDMYYCAQCIYKTKHKSSLRKHILTHHNASEEGNNKYGMAPKVKICFCKQCAYKTEHKHNLRRHLVSHRDASEEDFKYIIESEVKMYICECCPYKTKRISDLRRHIITYKQATEGGDCKNERMYNCEQCTYSSSRKFSLQRHRLTHKQATEEGDCKNVRMYNCEQCTYSSGRKCSLQRHMLTHKQATEERDCKNVCDSKVMMYNCEQCTYSCRRKSSLQWHMLTHKVVKCDVCDYQSTSKSELLAHSLSHKSYRCKLCGHQTKYLGSIKRHIRVHKDVTSRS